MSDYLIDYRSESNTEEDLKNITHVDTSFYALETNLASLKTKFDKLDIPKLTT